MLKEAGTTGRYSRRKVASNWSRYDDKEDDSGEGNVERESSRRPLLSIDDSGNTITYDRLGSRLGKSICIPFSFFVWRGDRNSFPIQRRRIYAGERGGGGKTKKDLEIVILLICAFKKTSAFVSPLIDIDCSHLAESLSSIPMGKRLNIADEWLPADDSLVKAPL